MIGRYLDALPEAARWRVLAARRWTACAYADAQGRHCLLGHAENWGWANGRLDATLLDYDVLYLRRAVGDDFLNWPSLLAHRFEHLCDRYGLERVVKWIQQRAAPGRRAPAVMVAEEMPDAAGAASWQRRRALA